MTDFGIWTKNVDIQAKAGTNANATAKATAATDVYVLEVESFVNATTTFNWSDAYAGLNADVKDILKMITSNICAINVIQWDMSGFTSRRNIPRFHGDLGRWNYYLGGRALEVCTDLLAADHRRPCQRTSESGYRTNNSGSFLFVSLHQLCPFVWLCRNPSDHSIAPAGTKKHSSPEFSNLMLKLDSGRCTFVGPGGLVVTALKRRLPFGE